MIKIDKSQAEQLANAKREEFGARLSLHYRDIFPDQADDLGPERTEALMDWAIKCDVTTRYDIQRLGEILIEEGLPIENRPVGNWIAEGLDLSLSTGANRIDLLREEELARTARVQSERGMPS